MPTALITGALGFIGSHLTDRLLVEGFRIIAIDNLSTGKTSNLSLDSLNHPNLDICKEDIRNLEAVIALASDCDLIFHHAAIASVPKSIETPCETTSVNYLGTLNLLEAARINSVKRFIFASSAAIYGSISGRPVSESTTPFPLSPYGVDKLASEMLGYSYQHNFGLEFVALRYFNVYGSRQNPSSSYAGVISLFCNAFKEKRQPLIYGDGSQSRDFVHVRDVVNANILAARSPEAAGKIFNVATGYSTSLLEIIDILQTLTGTTLKPCFEEARSGDIIHSLADVSKLSDLGWKPSIRLLDGLQDLLNSIDA
jgi:UDP-glucose 4-epimerase